MPITSFTEMILRANRLTARERGEVERLWRNGRLAEAISVVETAIDNSPIGRMEAS